MSNEFRKIQPEDFDIDSLFNDDPIEEKKPKEKKNKARKPREEKAIDPRLATRFIIPSTGLVPLESRLPNASRMKTDLRRREVYRLKIKENLTLNEIRLEILNRASDFLDDGRYSLAAVRNDLTSGIRLIATEIKELAKAHFQIELDKLDDLDQRAISHLDSIDYKLNALMMEDSMDIVYVDMVTKLIAARNTLHASILRNMERRTKYLGMDMPTKSEATVAQMNISLDDFLKAREQFISENDSNIIDGSVRYLDEPSDVYDQENDGE